MPRKKSKRGNYLNVKKTLAAEKRTPRQIRRAQYVASQPSPMSGLEMAVIASGLFRGEPPR